MSRRPVEARFWPKVDRRGDDECWPWLAYVNPYGYGGFHLEGRPQHAHRVAYRLLVGPIPEGLDLDHLCRNRACVNPTHLEPVTRAENVMRGESLPAQLARMTHCRRGHEFTPENTYRSNGSGRRCKTCFRMWFARRRARQAAS